MDLLSRILSMGVLEVKLVLLAKIIEIVVQMLAQMCAWHNYNVWNINPSVCVCAKICVEIYI